MSPKSMIKTFGAHFIRVTFVQYVMPKARCLSEYDGFDFAFHIGKDGRCILHVIHQ